MYLALLCVPCQIRIICMLSKLHTHVPMLQNISDLSFCHWSRNLLLTSFVSFFPSLLVAYLLSLAAPATIYHCENECWVMGFLFWFFFFGLITVSFQFIKIFQNLKKSLVPFYFIFKKSKSKNHQHQLFRKPQRTGSFHEWTIKNMQFCGWLFHFSSFLRTMVIYQNPFFIFFLRTMVINQRTVPVTTGSVPACYDHKGLIFIFIFSLWF